MNSQVLAGEVGLCRVVNIRPAARSTRIGLEFYHFTGIDSTGFTLDYTSYSYSAFVPIGLSILWLPFLNSITSSHWV